jgi:hypothetical protein
MTLRQDSQRREDYHDKGPKTLLNGFQPAGRPIANPGAERGDR